MTTIITVFLLLAAGIVLLYLLLLCPGLRKHPDREAFRKVLYAHRGLHDNASDAPENSMAAFQKAVEAGFGIELDVQLTKDRIPVVFHDGTLKRVCGAGGRVADYTYEELQRFTLCGSRERIPQFETVLQLIDGKVPLIIEYKTETTDTEVCPVTDRLLRTYRGLYCIESFNPLVLWWYRKHCPQICRGQLADALYSRGERKGWLYFALEHLLFNLLTAPDFIAYNHKHPKKLSVLICRRFYHNTMVAWTIKKEEELKNAGSYFDQFIFDSFMPEK